jgi:hypothetical protein
MWVEKHHGAALVGLGLIALAALAGSNGVRRV